ncbi:hypothetical protein JZ751_017162, partial [Albula glossodonta]
MGLRYYLYLWSLTLLTFPEKINTERREDTGAQGSPYHIPDGSICAVSGSTVTIPCSQAYGRKYNNDTVELESVLWRQWDDMHPSDHVCSRESEVI